MITISIIIPNLNSTVIDRTLEGIERQSVSKDSFEVIVVGRDEPGLVLENDLIRFVCTPAALIPGQARNLGVKNSIGEILVFLDADCVPRPDWLAVIQARYQDQDMSVLGGAVDIDSNNLWTLVDNLSLFHEFLASKPPGDRLLLASLNLAIRRSAFNNVGGFDESRVASEDSDLSLRLRQAGYNLRFEPRAVVHHLPPRNTLRSMLKHHYHQGKHSIKVNPRYANNGAFPRWLRSSWALILLSPLLALGATIRVYRSALIAPSYVLVSPLIYLSKLAWCFGAAHQSQQ